MALAVVVGWFGWSMGTALTAPGSDSTAARLAEWGRGHDLGWAVTGLERARYTADQPRMGGNVPGGVPTLHARGADPAASTPRGDRGSDPIETTPSPSPLPPLTEGVALAGEGQWQTLATVHGHPAARVAFLRPDPSHTSYLDDVVWMDPRLLRFQLFPGVRYPGQPYTGPSRLAGADLNRVLATFNSGFQLKDSRGGYWQDGKTTQALRKGAASMVFGTDGSLTIKPWPGGTPGHGIQAVRQSLTMLISHGRVSPLVAGPRLDTWGVTVGNRAYVWRTGIGVRADGSIVFVLGPALDIQTLANVLSDAGAVDAMELDINPSWTDFFTYTHPSRGVAVPTRLGRDTLPAIRRYLKPCSRDFVAVFPR